MKSKKQIEARYEDALDALDSLKPSDGSKLDLNVDQMQTILNVMKLLAEIRLCEWILEIEENQVFDIKTAI